MSKSGVMTKGKVQIVSLGNYQMTGKLLGKGNFARVEEAVHKILGKKVAVKIIDTRTIKEEYVLRNLYREPKIMARLHHPCITCLYETMMNGSKFFMVTELVAGGDLCTYVKRQRAGHLTEAQTRSYARQLTSAIAHMHACGVVHRDLKMENIMLDSSKEFVKIVDFGLGNTWTPETILKTRCGSLEYAAPELFIVSRRYGPEIDLWSLGVILYGMLTGRLPFLAPRETDQADCRRKLLQSLARGFGRSHKAALLECSPESNDLIEQLLQADVKKRITVNEVTTHPWIRQSDKRLKLFPLGKINPYMKEVIYNQIGEIFNIQSAEVIKRIKDDPYGPDGGILNIKSHQQALSQMKPEILLWSSNSNENIHHATNSMPMYYFEKTRILQNHDSGDKTSVAAGCERTKNPKYLAESTSSPIHNIKTIKYSQLAVERPFTSTPYNPPSGEKVATSRLRSTAGRSTRPAETAPGKTQKINGSNRLQNEDRYALTQQLRNLQRPASVKYVPLSDTHKYNKYAQNSPSSIRTGAQYTVTNEYFHRAGDYVPRMYNMATQAKQPSKMMISRFSPRPTAKEVTRLTN